MTLVDAISELREAIVDLAAALRWIESEGGDSNAAFLIAVEAAEGRIPDEVFHLLRRGARAAVAP